MKNWDEHTWLEDIIYCPSQIFYYFTDSAGKYWCAYIRQRGGPVTLEMIELDENEEFPWYNSDDKWHKVILHREYDINGKQTEEEEEKEIIDLEEETLEFLRQRFPAVLFPEQPPRKSRKIR